MVEKAMRHYPNSPSKTYYRFCCVGYESGSESGYGNSSDAEFGTDLHERTVTGDRDGLGQWENDALDFCDEQTEKAVKGFFGDTPPKCAIEKQMVMRDRKGEVFTGGTPDRAYWGGKRGLILDYKFGRYPIVNLIQLELYGLGLAQLHDLEEIRHVLVAPFMPEGEKIIVTTTDNPIEAYDRWLKITEEALIGRGKLTPKRSACIHCANLPTCIAAREKALTSLGACGAEPTTGDEVAALLGKIREFDSWAKAFRKWATQQAQQGLEIDGWKLKSRAGRTTVDDKDKFAACLSGWLDVYAIEDCSSISVPEARKLFVKKFADTYDCTIADATETFQELIFPAVTTADPSWYLDAR